MVALIVVVPVATELAIPFALMVATFTSVELQLTCVLRICVLPSLKCPVAANCTEVPRAVLVLLGLMVIEVRVAFVTCRDAPPFFPANSAVMVVVPGAIPLAVPASAEARLIVATEGVDDVQITESVRFCVLPSPKVPIA